MQIARPYMNQPVSSQLSGTAFCCHGGQAQQRASGHPAGETAAVGTAGQTESPGQPAGGRTGQLHSKQHTAPTTAGHTL